MITILCLAALAVPPISAADGHDWPPKVVAAPESPPAQPKPDRAQAEELARLRARVRDLEQAASASDGFREELARVKAGGDETADQIKAVRTSLDVLTADVAELRRSAALRTPGVRRASARPTVDPPPLVRPVSPDDPAPTPTPTPTPTPDPGPRPVPRPPPALRAIVLVVPPGVIPPAQIVTPDGAVWTAAFAVPAP
jgi:hypothetical protein